MYCVFAMESIKKMNGSRGKLASMAGHAYLHAFWKSVEEEFEDLAYLYYDSERAYKITLVVDTVEELLELENEYKKQCGTSLVTDAALTVFNEPTTVCLGIGPIIDVGESLKRLKVLT